MRRRMSVTEEAEARNEIALLKKVHDKNLERRLNVPSLRPSWLLVKAMDQIDEDRKEIHRLRARAKMRELESPSRYLPGEGLCGD